MSLRNTLRKAAELLVELPPEEAQKPEVNLDDALSSPAGSATDKLWADLEKASQKPGAPAPTKTVDQIVREGEGPNLDQIKVAANEVPPIVNADGAVNFNAIYQAANLPTVPFTSEQILEMLAALPAELPLDTKRQMIKVSINSMGKTIGVTPENIVADASRKLAALAAYTDHLAKTTNEYVTLSEQKISLLQAQIEETRKAIAAAQQKQTHDTELCTNESHRLDEVLEFFSLDVPPSKYAPSESKP